MQSVIKIFAYLLECIIIVEYAEYYQLQMTQTPSYQGFAHGFHWGCHQPKLPSVNPFPIYFIC